MKKGVYVSKPTWDIVIIHKVAQVQMYNKRTGEVTTETVVTMEASKVPMTDNVIIQKDQIQHIEYVGQL